MINKVVKFDGSIEDFDANKLNKWAEFASVVGVDWGVIALNAYKKCTDGCSTLDLHKAMIDACVEQEDENHLRMAGRLLIGVIYKEAFGGFSKIPKLMEFYYNMRDKNYWAFMDYSLEEMEELNKHIDHSKDLGYNYTTLRQIKDKYLIQNRVTKMSLESPQFMFMGMAMQNMEKQPKETRIQDVVKLYTYLSDLKINAPTPFLVNMRTNLKGYASCCVIKAGDTLDSLAVADHISYMMTAKSAGIGVNIGSRSKGDPVRGGQIVHQGKLPYFRANQALVHANLQSSRGGASTISFSALDPEVEDFLVLKNPTTVTQKRIRDIDYSLLINRLFIEKVAKNEEWMLVSKYYAPKLYDLFYSDDYEAFKNEYELVMLADVPKKIVKARDIANRALKEGVETGRIYITYIDQMNHQTPFKDTIYSSNLCQEIGLPTKPYIDMQDLYNGVDPQGEIGLCSLASIVLGRVTDEEYEDVAYYTVLMVDNVIDLMEYPFPSLEKTAKARRSIGIGLTNLAYTLADKGLLYSSREGKSYMHQLAERHAYWLYKASLRLGKEKGNAEWIDKTKYPVGWFPYVDSKFEAINEVCDSTMMFNWSELSTEIYENGGIRNSTLMAYMPVESSSQLTNTTNGLYPVRNLKVVKTSNTNKNLLIAPDYDRLKDKYEIAWTIDTNDLIDMYAIFQKFTDQGISADLYIDMTKTDTVSTSTLLKGLIYMHKMGLKTRYYINSASGIVHDSFKKDEVVVEKVDDSCTACKL